MIHSRQQKILKELVAIEGSVTSGFLAKRLKVTSRTIRDDISSLDTTLRKNGAEVESKRGKGYRLTIHDDSRWRSFLEMYLDNSNHTSNDPDSPEERVKAIIRKLLLADDYVKIEELADKMLVSYSTLQNDLKRVRKLLHSYELTLEKRPNYGLIIQGDEVQLRFCTAEYLFDRSVETPIDKIPETLRDVLEDEQFQSIWSIVMEEVTANQIELSDIQINNLFVHIVIAYKRVKTGHYITLVRSDLKEIEKNKHYHAAEKLVKRLENTLDITFPEIEIAYVALHLMGTSVISEGDLEINEMAKLVEDDIIRLVETIVNEIEKQMSLNVAHDCELYFALCLHLKPAINRFRYGMNVRNPLLQDIKQNYPLAFDAGIIASTVIYQEKGIEIDENEVGYLALHIGSAVERKKMERKEINRVMIVCASGLGSAQLIKYKIQSQFADTLEVMKTTEYYKLNRQNFQDVDFIISSVPLEEEVPVPVVHVNTIINDQDLKKIEEHMSITDDVFNYISMDLLFLQRSLTSQDEALKFLTGELQKKGLVDESFADSVKEREAISPTAYGNFVAIPHPLKPLWAETFLAICTLQKPVDWGGHPVQFIAVLNVKKDSQEDLQHLYALLTQLIEKPEKMDSLLKCERKDVFIRELVDEA